MAHTKLYFKMLRDDPAEQVIWNQERPIAYLNCADASIEEFVQLENMIQSVPELQKFISDLLWWANGPKEYADELHAQYWVPDHIIQRAQELSQKASSNEPN